MNITINNLSKTFTDTPVLDRVSLDIRAGELFFLLGASGCGKTTLMNIVAGLETATRGVVEADGKPVTGPSPERGVIFQQYALFPWLSVRKNVEFGLSLKRMAPGEKKRIAEHYIDLVGLSHAADQIPKQLSGGMKIGRAHV